MAASASILSSADQVGVASIDLTLGREIRAIENDVASRSASKKTPTTATTPACCPSTAPSASTPA